MNLDFKKLFAGAKKLALELMLKTTFIIALGFLALFVFSSGLAYVLGPIIGNGTAIFGKLLCNFVTHSTPCVALQLMDYVYIIFVVFLGAISIFGILVSIVATLTAAATGVEPTSKIGALLINFITGICVLILIVAAAIFASVLMLGFAILSFGLFIYLKRKIGSESKISTIVGAVCCFFAAIFALFAWLGSGIPLLAALVPSFVLMLLALVLIADLVMPNLGAKGAPITKNDQINCLHCQKEIEVDSVVCGYCGKRLYLLCKACGKKYSSELNYCPSCGIETTQVAEKKEVVKQPTKKDIKKAFCERCGEKVDGKYCEKCGAKVGG